MIVPTWKNGLFIPDTEVHYDSTTKESSPWMECVVPEAMVTGSVNKLGKQRWAISKSYYCNSGVIIVYAAFPPMHRQLCPHIV